MVGPYSEKSIFNTMVRHPRLFKRWVPFGTAMLYAKLPTRDRELLILRTAFRCECNYEWSEHKVIAAGAGISAEEISMIERGPADAGWQPFDAALVRSVDELLDDNSISDSTWRILAERYDERLLIEVPMVVGHYYTTALMLNTLRVPLDPAG